MSARQPHELLLAASQQAPVTSSLVSTVDGQPVTTTLKVADGTASNHEAVIKLVRTYQGDLEEFGRVRFEIQPFATAGGTQKREYAVLNEEQSTLLLAYMRNTDIVRQFKKALIRDFFQMRRALAATVAPALPNFADPAAAARAWADEVEAKRSAEGKVQQLEHQVAVQAPMIDAFDRLLNADGTMSLTNAAKALQVQPSYLISWLLDNEWIFKRKRKYFAYERRLQSDHLRHKASTYEDPNTGHQKVSAQVMVTGKGLAKLGEKLAQQAMARRLAFGAGQDQQRLPLPEDGG